MARTPQKTQNSNEETGFQKVKIQSRTFISPTEGVHRAKLLATRTTMLLDATSNWPRALKITCHRSNIRDAYCGGHCYANKAGLPIDDLTRFTLIRCSSCGTYLGRWGEVEASFAAQGGQRGVFEMRDDQIIRKE
jgi:hypothetical protein